MSCDQPDLGTERHQKGIVSVVIPAFNGEDRIADAIESAFAEGPIVREVIVVDDGSTDETAKVVRNFPKVKLLQQENAGPAAARNVAIRASSGEFIAPLDHDDLFVEGRLHRMVKALEVDPEALFAVGRQQLVIEPGVSLPYWLNSSDPSELDRFRGEHGTGISLMRRSAFDAVGLFDETLTEAGEDTDWVLRSIDLGFRHVTLEETVTVRRLHGRNITLDEAGNRRAMFQVLQRRAQRRRAP